MGNRAIGRPALTRCRKLACLAGGVVSIALASAAPAFAAPPANDNFANATKLSGPSPIVVSANNIDATKQTGEPNHAGEPGGSSVWYRWSPPATGEVVLDACFPDFDTVLGVYKGSTLETLTEVTANDDNPGQCALDPNGSLVTFKAFRYTNYWIAVDGSGGAEGNSALVLSYFPDPKVSVGVGGLGAGTVTSDPAGIECGNGYIACSSGFSIFSTVTLTAQPAPGSVFDHWNGACSGSPAACELFMTEAKSAKAVFRQASGRPDALLRRRATAAFLGSDVYDDGTSQTLAVTRGAADVFVFKVENDADVTDTITIQGCGSSADFNVLYTLPDAVTTVTSDVVAGTMQFNLQPGGKRTLNLYISKLPPTPIGSVKSCPITVTSANDPAKSDTVVAQLTIG